MKNDNENLYKLQPSPEKTGKFISELRKEKGYSQEALSKKLYVSRKAISKWENGNCYPSIDIFPVLIKLFDVSFSELLNGARKAPGEELDEAGSINFIIKFFKRKQINSFIRFFVIILFLCLSIFYFENYNATKIYGVWFDDEEMYIEKGMIVTTRSGDYFNFGYFSTDLATLDNNKSIDFTLYLKDKDYVVDLLSFSIDNPTHFEKNNYKELSEFNVKNKLDNLYIKIKYTDIYDEIQEKDLKLNYKLYYQSNDFNNIIHPSKNENILNNDVYPALNDSITDSKLGNNIDNIDLSFLFDLDAAEIKEKFNNKVIFISDDRYKVSYDNDILQFTNKKYIISINFKEYYVLIYAIYDNSITKKYFIKNNCVYLNNNMHYELLKNLFSSLLSYY